MSFTYSTEFTLNKAYFIECYEQTAQLKRGLKAYSKALILFAIGCLAAMVESEYQSAAFFIIVLAIVEAASVYFHKTWWLWRQLLSKAANNKIALIVDDAGISTSSPHQNLMIVWNSVTELIETDKGFIIQHAQGRSYLSLQSLSLEAIDFIRQQLITDK